MGKVQFCIGSLVCVLLCRFVVVYSGPSTGFYSLVSGQCPPFPKDGIEWIMRDRRPDFGWRENTHRATIAVAVSDTAFPEEEKLQMAMQLNVEITNFLLRNSSSQEDAKELALYIHALVAIDKNPRDFNGIDLVADLIHRVETAKKDVHPFLVLALCNSKVVVREHVKKIRKFLLKGNGETTHETALKALAVKAVACAASLDIKVTELHHDVDIAIESLINLQGEDGSFGNLYSTALAVQALIANGTSKKWDRYAALEYLREQSKVDVNMVSAYYTELALNADYVPFIKDLHPNSSMVPTTPVKDAQHAFMQYTIRNGPHPDVYFTINIRFTPRSTFFDIMKRSAAENSKFNFLYYLDIDRLPMIYSISGVPNDAEENLYWRLCLQANHSHKLNTVTKSPALVYPEKNQHFIFWYKDRDC